MAGTEEYAGIDIADFNSHEDEFEEWVELFESAVMLSTNERDAAALPLLYRQWLPLKLDRAARAALKQATSNDWKDLKDEMVDLLVDPQEKAKWQAKKTTIRWDGKESIHSLASRIKRAVDKYERGMPEEFKEREYYQRFKNAFKSPMRKFISCNCTEDNRTIEAAKEVALRYHIAGYEDNDVPEDEPETFSSCTHHSDRVTGIERMIAKIQFQISDIEITMRNHDARLCKLEHDMERFLDSFGVQDHNRDLSNNNCGGEYDEGDYNNGHREWWYDGRSYDHGYGINGRGQMACEYNPAVADEDSEDSQEDSYDSALLQMPEYRVRNGRRNHKSC